MSMPLTTQSRYLFRDRRLQAKWVLAARYIKLRNLRPYGGISAACRMFD